MALLRQPVERPAAELDAVRRGLASERGVWVVLGQSGSSPPLRRRRALETLEKVAEKGRLSVVVGEGGLAGRIVKMV